MLHPLTWLIWLSVVIAMLSITRNPLYLGLILGWIGLVAYKRPRLIDAPPLPLSPWRFALVVMLTSALFNGLTAHFGSTVLFQLPRSWPLIGGSMTLEAIIFGLLNGLTLSGIYGAFSVINQTLSVRALIRLIPQTFYPVAVVAAIAVTFVPVTLRQLQQIREAQAIRGHRLRGLRDWLPLMIPLLIGGLERALQLAEAMTARGFASVTQPTHEVKSQLAVAIGLLLLLSGWLLRLGWEATWLGTGILLSGVTLILVTMWLIGRRVPRTIYRPDKWHRRDSLVVGSLSLSALLFIFPFAGLDRSSIFYYPYPTLTWPNWHGLIIAATLGLLSPILWPTTSAAENQG
jgi:energy-coupling factor transport system permease protein